MPLFKVIPVVLILFLIRKERRGKGHPVAVIRSHSESQKEPRKDPLHFAEGESGPRLSEKLPNCRNTRINIFFLTKTVKYQY